MLTSISSLVAIVMKGLMIWGSKCHQNNLPVVWDGYVKYRQIILIVKLWKTKIIFFFIENYQ